MSEGERAEAVSATVLVLASTYPRWAGDPEPGFVHELARRLGSGLRVVAVVPDSADAAPSGPMDGVEVIRYRYAPRRLQTLVNDGGIVTNLKRAPWKWLLVPGFILGLWWASRRAVRRCRVDVIHAHWILPQGLVACLLGRPVLVTSHGADLFALKGWLATRLKRWVLSRCDATTVVSQAMVLPAVDLAPGVRPPTVQPMGVDLTGRFAVDPGCERSTDELLFVGRLVEKKGLKYLVDALPALVVKHPALRLNIAGFGPEEAGLKRQVSRLRLEDHVVFLGAVPQTRLPSLYRRAAAFVAPFVEARGGDQEGLGLVVVEALGSGCPVVTTRIPAVAEVFDGTWPAFAVAPGDADALADAVDRVLRWPEEARLEAAHWSARVRERFDWARVATGYRERLVQMLPVQGGAVERSGG